MSRNTGLIPTLPLNWEPILGPAWLVAPMTGESDLRINLCDNDQPSHLPLFPCPLKFSQHAMPPEFSIITSQWRTRPVFISSTFRDMQAERDHLRNFVLPRLEEERRKRRHHLEWIDLRQGVESGAANTEEQRELIVLKVCLDEIKRSRPFLIVFLGDRLGAAGRAHGSRHARGWFSNRHEGTGCLRDAFACSLMR